MRKIFFVLVICLSALPVNSQTKQTPVRISQDLELIKISDNAYVHVSYKDVKGYGRTPANGLIFINKGDAFLFDTPWDDSLTKELVSYLRNEMKLNIAGFVPNHWHEDCMGGLKYLKSQNIATYANRRTIEIARKKNLPVAEHSFDDSLQLKLGDEIIKCYYLGAAHSTDNIVVWIPSEKILFPGCMVKTMAATNLGNTEDGDLKAYPVTIKMLMDKFRSAKIVIPGHGPIGGFDIILHTYDLITK